MMREGRWLPGEQPDQQPVCGDPHHRHNGPCEVYAVAEQPAEPSPAVAMYRRAYRDGRFDTLSEVLGILGSVPPAPGPYADAHRAIRALFTELARGER